MPRGADASSTPTDASFPGERRSAELARGRAAVVLDRDLLRPLGGLAEPQHPPAERDADDADQPTRGNAGTTSEGPCTSG